jgi:DNA polymerase
MTQQTLIDSPPEIIWHEDPNDLDRLYEYCKQDVEATYELDQTLDDLTETEKDLWQLDARMNMAGVKVDLSAAMVAAEGLTRNTRKIHTRVSTLTEGAVSSVRQVAALRGWIKEYSCGSVDLPDLAKATVEKALKGDLPPVVRELLELRQAGSKSSTAKLDRMIQLADPDDHRSRGNLIYHGAAPGRWTGAGIQMHNFPRGNLKPVEVEQAFTMLDNPEAVEVCFGGYAETVSNCLRGFLIADEGKTFIAADYSAIEARVLCWVAGQDDALDLFRKGEDVYMDMAKSINPRNPSRQLGKQAILGLGYGMGWKKFKTTCEGYGIPITEKLARLTVDTYRDKYSRVVWLWKSLECDTSLCIEHGADVTTSVDPSAPAYKLTTRDDFLFLHLPSGRRLAYHNPRVQAESKPGWSHPVDQIVFDGLNSTTKKWTRQTTYGGKLVENLVQAIARDLLAEALVRVDQGPFNPVLTVHDEIVCEEPDPVAQVDVEYLCDLMCILPAWAEGLPLAAEGWKGKRFRK